MNAHRTALAVLVAASVAAPAAASAAAPAAAPRCGGATTVAREFVVGASSEVRNVAAGGRWVSVAVVERRVADGRVPAADVSVELSLRLAGGHLLSTSGRTDHLGRVRLDLAVPRTTAAGLGSALWAASEEADVPCGPRVDTYGERVQANAVRITR